jgi:hypothetical protein
MNFVLKQVGRDYVKRLSVKNPGFAGAYRTFMQFMVRRHRSFGIAAAVILALHVAVVVLTGYTSLTGAAAGALLLATAGLGLYGFHVVKIPRGRWLHGHRTGAFLLFVAAVAHIFYKAYVFL